MKLVVVILFVALKLCVLYTLAFEESKHAKGFKVRRLLMPKIPKIPVVDHERKPLQLRYFEELLKRSPAFSYAELTRILNYGFENHKPPENIRDHKGMNMDAMFHVLFESKFEDAIRVAIKTNDERYVDIGLYVAVLRYVGGSTRRAVILIETAKKRPEHKTVAEKMEHGQFFLWSIVPLSKEDAAKYIFRSKQTDKVDALLQRYDAYLNADLTPEEVKTALELLKTFLTP